MAILMYVATYTVFVLYERTVVYTHICSNVWGPAALSTDTKEQRQREEREEREREREREIARMNPQQGFHW